MQMSLMRTAHPAAENQKPERISLSSDGKDIVPLPTHGKLISVRKIKQTQETMLTYVVNDREFPIINRHSEEEEQFKEFLKGCGMHRVF